MTHQDLEIGIDPILTAAIYCNRRLDYLLRDAIAPFWRHLSDDVSAEPQGVWFIRYGRCGEHLKLRLHGPESLAQRAKELLPGYLERFFASSASEPVGPQRLSKPSLPPLGPEDESDDDYPNKTWLWTEYRRAPQTFGCDLYVRDDHHAGLFYRAAAATAEAMMVDVVPKVDDADYLSHRQNAFIKLLLIALAATDLKIDQWREYFVYHRDWLIRTLVLTAPPGAVSEESILAEYAPRIERMSSGVEALAHHALRGSRMDEPSDGSDAHGDWSRAVADLYGYAAGYRGCPEYDQDPYTRDFAFLPLFKVLHGAANQFGFRLSHEAYIHHVLLAAADTACALAEAEVVTAGC